MSKSQYISDDEGGIITTVKRIPHGIKRRSLTEKRNRNHDIIKPQSLTVQRKGTVSVDKSSLLKSKMNLDKRFKSIARKDRRKTRFFSGEDDLINASVDAVDGDSVENIVGEQSASDNESIEIGRGRENVHFESRSPQRFALNKLRLQFQNDDNIESSGVESDGFFETQKRVLNNFLDESQQLSNDKQQSFSDEEDYPRTPIENEIKTPLVSPGFSIKRRSLVGEVGTRKSRKIGNEVDTNTLDSLIARAKMNGIKIGGNDRSSPRNSPAKRTSPVRPAAFLDDSEDGDVILDNEDFSRVHESAKKVTSYHNKQSTTNYRNKESPSYRNKELDRKRFSMARRLFNKNNQDGDKDESTAEQSEEFYSVDSPVDGQNNNKNEPSTPTRMTEAVALSPRTEQESRVIDEADISLDTSAPPKVTRTVSPLSRRSRGILGASVSPSRRQAISPSRFSPERRSPVRSPEKSPKLSPERRPTERLSPAKHSSELSERRSPEMLDRRSPEILDRRSPEMLDKYSPEALNRRSPAFSTRNSPQRVQIPEDELLKDFNDLVNDTFEKESKSIVEDSFENPAEKPTFSIKQYAQLQNHFNDELKQLQDDVSMKNKEILNLSESLSSSQIEVQNLQHQIEELKLVEKQLNEKNNVLTKQFEIFEADLNALKTDNLSKDNKLTMFTSLSDKLKELYKQKQAELLKLRDLKQSNEAEIKSLFEDKEALTEKVEYLQSKAIQMNNELIYSQEKVKELEEELESLKNKHEEIDEENYGLKHQLDEFTKEKNTLIGRLDDVKATVESETTAKFELENQISDLKSEVSQLKRQLKKYEKDMELYQEDFKVKSLENDQLSRENSELNEMINHRNRQIDEYEDRIKEMSAKYVGSMKDNQSKLSEVSELNSLNSKLSFNVESLRKENEQLTNEVTVLSKEIKEAKSMLAFNDRDYEKLKSNYENVKADLKSKSHKLNDLNSQLQSIEEDHFEELNKIQRQVIVLQNTINSKNSEISHMEDNKMSLANENEKLGDKLSDAMNELNEAKRQINRLRAQQQENDKKTEERLKKLSDDLYVQYSQKHTNKVKLLKEGYEKKYSVEFNSVKSENETLKRDLRDMEKSLSKEQKEKHGLLKLVEKWASEQAGGRL